MDAAAQVWICVCFFLDGGAGKEVGSAESVQTKQEQDDVVV